MQNTNAESSPSGADGQRIEPSLESLPLEVQQMILFQSNSMDDLEAMVEASKTYYQASHAHRELIMTTVICRELSEHDADPRDALAAIWSETRIEPVEQDHKERVIAFLDPYRRADEKNFLEFYYPIRLDEYFSLVILIERADTITADFLKSVETADGKRIILTESERRRFRRAIFRWQTFCNVFQGYPRESNGFNRNWEDGNVISASERVSLFLAELAPWECEELFIITDHAWRRYTSFFIELSEVPWAQDVQMDVEWSGLPSRPYSRDFEDLSIDDRVDWLLTLGPERLYDFLTADDFDTSKSDWLMENNARTEWSILQVLIMGEPFHARYPTSQNQAWASQQKMDFEGDLGSKPNFGWVIANGMRYTVNWGLDLVAHGPLQKQGYVMWDEDRIKEKTLVHLKDLLTWED